jgi:two-component system OmpR family response regulator
LEEITVRILVVEDNADVARQIKDSLERELFVVDIAEDGESGWFMGDTETYDAVILDLGLPKLDGLTVLQRWRQSGNQVPVLILTSRDTWREKVTGLRAGADDYLAKPFELEELLARLEALLRRATGHASPILKSGPVELDTVSARVTMNGMPVNLTAQEYRALQYMMQNEGKVVSKSELSEHIYEQVVERDSNVIEVLINHLRNKLEPSLIKTRRGLGYQLVPDDDA